MSNTNHIMTYKKANASEIIEIGDLVMLDPATASITRAVINDCKEVPINTRLVVGVCISSDNFSPFLKKLDGGTSEDVTRIKLEAKSDSIETIIITSGNSGQNSREIIQVAYMGEYPVNVQGFVDLGDKLCISNVPGKAKAINYIDRGYFNARSIGKVVKYLNNKNQVKVLLDIE